MLFNPRIIGNKLSQSRIVSILFSQCTTNRYDHHDLIISLSLPNKHMSKDSFMSHLVVYWQSRCFQKSFDMLKYLIHSIIYQKTLIDINDLTKHALPVKSQRPIAQNLLIFSFS